MIPKQFSQIYSYLDLWHFCLI